MERRIVWTHCLVLFCLTILMVRLSVLGQGEALATAADRQSTSVLELGSTRGNIYDRNGKPLVNRDYITALAVTPSPQAAAALKKALPQQELEEALELLRGGRPVVLRTQATVDSGDGIQSLALPVRYGREQLAAHLVGYVDEGGSGVTGVEKGYDNLLKDCGGTLAVRYVVNANRAVAAPGATELLDSRGAPQGGVVLTLDRRFQEGVEQAMDAIPKGAAVVMKVDDGEILAMASRPVYDVTNIAASLDSPDSPFFNRALGAYNVGSSFKLCLAAAALESGWDTDYSYHCKGYYQLGEQKYYCHYRSGHGTLDMVRALEKSCNPYFINLGQQLGAERIYNMAYGMGFGSAARLGEGITSAAGVLPTISRLEAGELANFSFGQGCFTATPVQVAQMVSVIANGGMSVAPTVCLGTTTDGGEILRETQRTPARRVMSPSTAATLREMLVGVVEEGSGTRARPDQGGAGGKTATAQTGVYLGEDEIIHGWFAGFYPAQDPQYAVVVLAEGGGEGSETPARVFASICDAIAKTTLQSVGDPQK